MSENLSLAGIAGKFEVHFDEWTDSGRQSFVTVNQPLDLFDQWFLK